jgi:cyclase
MSLGALWPAAGLLGQASLRAAEARAQSKYALPVLFDIEPAAPGVYAALARPHAVTHCNAVIFENAEDILVVDTHSSSTAVASLVAQIRKEITKKPVRYVVNTHHHGDHVQGTPAYRRIAPRADILSSEPARQALAADGGRALKRSIEKMRETLDSLKQRAASAKTPEERAYWERTARETADFVAEMKDYAPELPNVTLTRDLIIRDKAHELHLAFRGKGHTAGDIVVFCPQKKVIAGGDLLHNSSAFMGDGYPKAWPNTLLEVAEFDFQVIAGGHGSVHRDRRVAYDMATYISELADLVGRAAERGRPLEQIQKEITPETLVSFRGGYGRLIAAERFRQSPQLPGRTAEMLLPEIVRANVAQVHATLYRS